MNELKPTNGLCSDASYSHKTKVLEYKVIDLESGKVLYSNVIANTHFAHNIGEFFAVVRAIKYVLENSLDLPIYTYSKTALSWCYAKEVRSDILEDNPNLQDFVNKGVQYLKSLKKLPNVLKWETKQWGENPADYGRKNRVKNKENVKEFIETLKLIENE